MMGMNIGCADLTGAGLTCVRLRGTDLSCVDCSNVCLDSAGLIGVNFGIK